MTSIGDVVPSFRSSREGVRIELDEFVLVVGRGRGEHRWVTTPLDRFELRERLVDPVAALLGVERYLAYVNAALGEPIVLSTPSGGGGSPSPCMSQPAPGCGAGPAAAQVTVDAVQLPAGAP